MINRKKQREIAWNRYFENKDKGLVDFRKPMKLMDYLTDKDLFPEEQDVNQQ